VGNVSDGAAEQVNVDGSVISLTNAATGTTTTNGLTYTVTVSGGTATVVLSNATGVNTADVNTLINGISYQNTSQDPTAGARTLSLTQIVDTGGTANGGVDTSGVAIAATVTVLPVNDAPTLSVTATNGTFTEGAGVSTGTAVAPFSGAAVSTIEAGQAIKSLTFTVGNVSDGAAEQVNVDGSVVSLTNAATGTTVTNGLTYTVTVSGGTATVVLSKAAGVNTADVNSLINGISYQNTSQDPTVGARTMTLTQIVDTGGTTNGGVDTSGVAIAATITVIPVNDAPTLSVTATNSTFTEGAGVSTGTAVAPFSGASVSTIEAGQAIKSLTFTVGNVSDGAAEQVNVDGSVISLTNAAIGTTTTNGLTYTVTVSGGTATVVLSNATGVNTADVNTLINGISYQNTSQDPTAGVRTMTLTQIVDTGGTTNGGVDTSGVAIAATVTVVPVNDAPTLSVTATNGTFTEGAGVSTGNAVAPFSGAAVSTIEAGQAIKSLTFTVGNVSDGAAEQVNVDGSVISLTNAATGTTTTNGLTYTVTVSGGTATVVLSKAVGVSTASVNTLINGISYQNTSQDPTVGARTMTLTQIVDTGGTTNGGVDTTGVAIAATVTVIPVNDAPTLNVTATNGTFTEGAGVSTGNAVAPFSGAAISTIEAGQAIKSLTFTVGNVSDGAAEQVNVDGSVIALTNAATGTTTTNGLTYTVTVSGGTATVVLSKAAGVSTASVNSLINGISYQNTSQDPTAGARTMTLTQIVDTGGTANGGVDTTGVAIAATVTVVPVNDAPTLSVTATNGTFIEGAGVSTGTAVAPFSGAAVSTIEAGQAIKSLTFTVGNVSDGAAEQVNVDGSIIALTNAATGTTITNGLTYTVTVSGGTATVVLSKAAGVNSADLNTLINGISYQNASQDPTAGARTMTLTQIVDTAGTANGGVDTTGLVATASIVVVPVNDAPSLTAAPTNSVFMEATGLGTQASPVSVFSGTNIDTVESNQNIIGLTFTVSGLVDGANESIIVDGKTISLGATSSGATTVNGFVYTVTVASGNATVALTSAGVSSSIANSVVNGIAYQNTNSDNPTAGNRVFTITQLKDSGGIANGGVDTVSLAIASTITVVPVNDAPTLSVTASNPTFTEASGLGTQASPVSVFSAANVNTVETGQNILGMTFTVSGLTDGVNESIVVDGKTITLDASSSGTTTTNSLSYTVTVASGNATVALTSSGISSSIASSVINGITYQDTNLDNPTAGNRVFTITQLKDSGGTANSGTDTSSFALASTVTVVPVNDAPTLSVTASNPTFTEASGLGTQASPVSVFSAANVSTIETGQNIVGLTFTVSGLVDGVNEAIVVDGKTITLNATTSGTTTTNGLSYTVTVASGTATVALTSTGVSSSVVNNVINGITYQDTNLDNPTAGNRVFTITQLKDSGGTANSGVDTTSFALSSTVTVVSVNDAPILNVTAKNPTFTEASGLGTQAIPVNVFDSANVNTIESGQNITGLTFTVGGLVDGANESIIVDGKTISLGSTSSGVTATNGLIYTVTVASGNATIELNSSGLSSTLTNSVINGITYQNTNLDNPTAGDRVFTITQIKDSGGTANSGADTTALSIMSTVTVIPVNDAPTATITAVNPTFTEGAGTSVGTPAVLFNNASVSTIEAGQSITSLTFTVGNVSNGTAEQMNVDGTVVTLVNASTGTTTNNGLTYQVTVSGGTATVVLSKVAGVNSTAVNSLINSLSYQNISQDPTVGARTVTLTQLVDNGGTAHGGVDTSNFVLASSVTVVPVNDAPTLNVTATNGIFTEGAGVSTGTAVAPFSGTSVSTIEAGQAIKSLTFTVGNVSDGAAEKVNVDGSVISLTNAATGTTATNGLTYTVTVSGGTATVVLSKTAGVSTANVNTLINGISYQNTSQDPTAGARTMTLTQIVDTGGTANGGVDTTGVAIAATVTVVPVNDAPTLSVTTTNGTFTEGAGASTGTAVAPFSGASVSTIEAGQAIKSLTFTVGNVSDGAAEQVNVDGSVISLTNAATGTTATNGLTYTVTVSGGTATVVLSNSVGVSFASVNTLINNISYQNTSQDITAGARTMTLTQLVDTGGTANGGVDTTGIAITATVTVVPVNDAPTVSVTTTNSIFTEGPGVSTGTAVAPFSGASVSTIEAGQAIKSLTFTVGNVSDGTAEKINVDGSVISLTNAATGTTVTNGLTYTVTVSGGTATVVLNKAAGVSTASVNALINGISYQNTSQDPTAGSRIVSLTQLVDTGGTANGGVDTTGVAIAATITVQPVNDAPTLSVTATNGTFTEGVGVSTGTAVTPFSGAAVSTIEAGQAIKSLTFTVGNVSDGAAEQVNVDGSVISLTNAATGTTTTNGLTYTVTVSGGTATVVLSKAAGVSSASVNSLINGMSYQNTSQDPTAGARTMTLTQIVDTGGTANGGVDTTGVAITATVTVVPVNDAPTLSVTTTNGTFTEGAGVSTGTAVAPFSGASVSTIEAGQAIKSLTFTVGNVSDGAAEQVNVDGSVISLTNAATGTTTTNGLTYTVTVSGGTATVVLSKAAGVSTASVNSLINGISYQNTSQDPTAGARTMILTQIVDTGGTANGGVDTNGVAIAATVTVIPVNDAPTLSVTATNGTFTEGAGVSTGTAVAPFSGAAVATIEAGQAIKSLTFTVGNVSDGAAEKINVDGSVISLTNAATGTTTTNGLTYTVTVSGGTATVVLIKTAGVSTANVNTLINGISYQNTSQDPTAGARTMTLAQIVDTAGTANGGVDTTGVAIAATVTVVPVNDAPTLSVTTTNGTFTEGAGVSTGTAVAPFSGASVSTIEAGQAIKSLTFTVGNISDGAAEQVNVDGSVIFLTNSATGTTTTNGLTYTVTVSGGTATVVLSKTAGVSTANINTLINGISYQNTSQDPTAGARVMTLTQMVDTGGVSNGGVDTTGFAVAASITVVPVNDAPTLTVAASNPTFTEASGLGTQASPVSVFSAANVSTIEAAQNIVGLTFTVSGLSDGSNELINVDGKAITLGSSNSGTTTTNGLSYTVNIVSGTATVTLTSAGVSSSVVSSVINGITYQDTNLDNPTAGNRVFTITQLKDSGGTSNGGVNTSAYALMSTVTVVSVNDAPTAVVTARNPTFTEAAGLGTQASPVAVFSGANLNTIESGQNFVGMTFTVSGLVDGANDSIIVDGKTITLGATSSGTTTTNGLAYTVTLSSGTATVALTSSGISSTIANSVVNGISYQNTNLDNPTAGNRVFTLTQIKDSGGTTNGGVDTTNLGISSTVSVVAVNDAPTMNVTTANGNFIEGAGSSIGAPVAPFSGASISTIETGQAIKSLTFTVGNVTDGAAEQVSVDGSIISLTNAVSGTTVTNGLTYNVTVSGGTATVVLSKAAGVSSANMDAVINALQYRNISQDPTAGLRTMTLTQLVDTGGTANGGVDTSGLAISASISVTPVNDAPTLSVTATNGTFTEGAGLSTGTAVAPFSGASVSTIEAGQAIKSLTFTVGNVSDGAAEQVNVDGSVISLTNAATGTTTTNGLTYTVTVSGGTATIVLSKTAGVSTAHVNALINGMTYQNTSQDPTAGARIISLTQLVDTGDTTNGGVNTTGLAISASVTVVPVNDAPTLSVNAVNGNFLQGAGSSAGSPAFPFSNASTATVEAAQAVKSLTFTVSNVSDGSSEQVNVDGAAISLTNATTGITTNGLTYTVTLSGNTATVVLSKAIGVSTSTMNNVINNLSYDNTSLAPTAGARIITLTQLVDTGGTSNNGVDTTALAIQSSIDVVPVNHAPTVNVTVTNGNYIEGAGTATGTPMAPFSGTSVSTIEGGQAIQSFTFTVANVNDGAAEQMNVDGSSISLVNAATGATATNGLTYNVTLNGNTATVVISKADGISTAAINTVINGLSYQNTSQDPTAGDRTITLTQLVDTGPTSNGGTNTADLAVAAHVNVIPTNDAPTLSVSPASNTTAIGNNGTAIFQNAVVSTIEAGQAIKALTFTVGNVVDNNETVNIDGTQIVLNNLATGTTTINNMSYSVSFNQNIATVVLRSASGISATATSDLIDSMTYSNFSSNPTLGSRVVTLAQIQDTGGTANNGQDITNGTLSSEVTVAVEVTVVAEPVKNTPTSGNPNLNLTQASLGSLNVQVFYNSSNISSSGSFDNSYSDSSYSQISSASATGLNNYARDPIATLLATSAHVPSWGWENLPGFIELTPIVKGLADTASNLTTTELGQVDELTEYSYQYSQPTSGNFNAEDFNDTSNTSYESLTQSIESSNAEANPAEQSDNVTAKNKYIDEYAEKQVIKQARNQTFKDKVKDLLRDFGISDDDI
jgi:hypothetical protein